VEITEKVDAEMIGGFVLNVGDRQIDAPPSRSKLKALKVKFSRESLCEGVLISINEHEQRTYDIMAEIKPEEVSAILREQLAQSAYRCAQLGRSRHCA
jgi:hypothetical protein